MNHLNKARHTAHVVRLRSPVAATLGDFMKNFFAARTLILLVLVTACSSAFAEYKAMATFRRCDLVGARLHVCDKLKSSNSEDMAALIQPTGAEEPDIKACEAIADNINEMEKYHYDWDCGFSISPKSYLLSKPQWVELSESERCDVLKLKFDLPASANLITCQSPTYDAVYATFYDLGTNNVDGKIYATQIRGSDCQHIDPISPHTRDVWVFNVFNPDSTTKKIRILDQYNSDPVLFSSRLYFIEYNSENFDKDLAGSKGFLVYAFRDTQTRIEKLNSYAFVCAVRKF